MIDISFPPGRHGLLYAVRDNEKALAALHDQATQTGRDEHHNTVKHISGRWFFRMDRLR